MIVGSKGQPEKSVIERREEYSRNKLKTLKAKLAEIEETEKYPNLTIIGAGSFARLEASEYSDIDMFFFYNADKKLDEPRTLDIRLFGKMIEIINELRFPKFSRDCEYLNVLSVPDMLKNLGNPTDDHQNYFTARMLLLLESQCLYGADGYDQIINKVIENYYKDYPRHEDDFEPTFLLNDICRYWKTILLNYENKRDSEHASEEDKIKRKVHNFKLKFSRMTTCFATICAIGSLNRPATKEKIIELIKATPRERLQGIPAYIPGSENIVDSLLEQYSWFLTMTGLSEPELHARFEGKSETTELFGKATKYGDEMFKLLERIDAQSQSPGSLIRHLVI